MKRRDSANSDPEPMKYRWSFPFKPSWDVFMPFQVDGTQYFLCYDHDSGALHCGKPSHSGGFRVSWPEISASRPLPAGLTAFIPFVEQPYFLYQDPKTATTTLVQLSQSSPNKIVATPWHIDLPGAMTLTPVMCNTKPYLLAYDSNAGGLTLYSIDLNDHSAQRLDTKEWDAGWTAFAELADADCALAYHPESGTLRACVLSDAPGGPKITYHDTRQLGTGWDRLAPIVGNRGPAFVVYATVSLKEPQIYTIDQFSPTLVLNYKSSLVGLFDVTAIMPFAFSLLGSDEYYLTYQRVNTATQAVSNTLLTITSGAKPGYPLP